MADLKTFWDDPGMPTQTDLTGDSITASGSDPNISTDGESAIKTFWDDPVVPALTSDTPSPNSVSGLPPLPMRYEPSSTPPELPDLTERRPGTIDEQ